MPDPNAWDDKDQAPRFFQFEHLPEDLQGITTQVYVLAEAMYEALSPGAEKSAGMHKLLEAKDAFVRQALDDRPRTQ